MNQSDDEKGSGNDAVPAVAAAPRRRPRWFVRGTVAALVGAVAFVSWWAWTAREQERAVAAIRALGGSVKYQDQLPFQSLSLPARWLNDWRGHDWAASAAQVNLKGADLGNDALATVGKLRGLQFLWLNGSHVDDQGLAHLVHLTDLEELYLADNPISDAGLVHLAGLTQLQFLSLAGTEVSDGGLKQLAGLNRLKRLDLPGTQVTSAGVAELQKVLTTTKIVYSQAGHGLRASSISAAGEPQDVNVQAHKKH